MKFSDHRRELWPLLIWVFCRFCFQNKRSTSNFLFSHSCYVSVPLGLRLQWPTDRKVIDRHPYGIKFRNILEGIIIFLGYKDVKNYMNWKTNTEEVRVQLKWTFFFSVLFELSVLHCRFRILTSVLLQLSDWAQHVSVQCTKPLIHQRNIVALSLHSPQECDGQTEVMVKFLIACYMYTFMFYYNNQLPEDQFPLRQANIQEPVNTAYLEGLKSFL